MLERPLNVSCKILRRELQMPTARSTQSINYRHYIDLLVNYPFGVRAKESFDIKQAREILDADHYGMKKVKQRILEFIAVSKLKGEFKCTYFFDCFS
jgi:ATP-dependent Lon protease